MKFSSSVLRSAKNLKNMKFDDTNIQFSPHIGVSSKDFTDLSNNMYILADAVKVSTTKVLALSLVQVLAAAQPRVPYDTGKLRESGNARILLGGRRGLVIARGTKSGTVSVMLNKITSQRTRSAKKIDAVIEYKRQSDDGKMDIALWTHEYLNPHGGAGPAAKQPGTGPKYLEIAWKETKNDFQKKLNEAVSNSGISKIVSTITKNVKKTKGKYTVDQRILSRDRIDALGYFG